MIGMLRQLFGRPKRPSINLPFKSSADLFWYQCEYAATDLVLDEYVVALVLNASDEAGTKAAVRIKADGNQIAMIKVASRDGGWITIAETANPGPPLQPGDLVAWLPMMNDGPGFGEDPRTKWIGLIVAKLAHVIHDGSIPLTASYHK